MRRPKAASLRIMTRLIVLASFFVWTRLASGGPPVSGWGLSARADLAKLVFDEGHRVRHARLVATLSPAAFSRAGGFVQIGLTLHSAAREATKVRPAVLLVDAQPEGAEPGCAALPGFVFRASGESVETTHSTALSVAGCLPSTPCTKALLVSIESRDGVVEFDLGTQAGWFVSDGSNSAPPGATLSLSLEEVSP